MTVPGGDCSDAATPHRQTGQGAVHLVDRVAAQLLRAGIPEVPATDLTWVARQVTSFNIPFRMTEPFVLFACDPAVTGLQDPIRASLAPGALGGRPQPGRAPLPCRRACPGLGWIEPAPGA